MRLRSGVSTTKTSGSLVKSCWRNEGKGGSSPKQPRQHGTPTCNSTGIQAATRNLPPSGTSGASTFAGPTGTTNSSGPRHLRQPHRRPRPSSVESCCRCSRGGPTSSPENDSDSHDDDDEDNDDDDDIDWDINNKLTAILAKEARRLALKRACRARYRARHPDRIAEQRRQYRAKNRDRVVEYRRQYYAKNRDRLLEQRRQYKKRHDAQRTEFMRRYYAAHAE